MDEYGFDVPNSIHPKSGGGIKVTNSRQFHKLSICVWPIRVPGNVLAEWRIDECSNLEI